MRFEDYIVVDESFPEAVVVVAVRKWLEDRGYEFGVRMIEMEKARGSGIVKKLRERVNAEGRTAISKPM